MLFDNSSNSCESEAQTQFYEKLLKEIPDLIVGARKHAPMLIGVGENENFIASDTPAIIEYTKKTIYLDDNEIDSYVKEQIRKKVIKPNLDDMKWDDDYDKEKQE